MFLRCDREFRTLLSITDWLGRAAMARAGKVSAGKSTRKVKSKRHDDTKNAVTPDIEYEPLPRSTDKGTRIGFLMHDISRLRRSAFDHIMKKIGVTRAQWWVIVHLSRHDGMMQVQLAEILDIGKASLGNLVERLENGGWVERRSDPADARMRRVYLTRKARQLIDQIHGAEASFNEETLRGLPRERRDEFLADLQRIKDNLKEVLRALE